MGTNPSLSWFGLTDGWFWIEAGEQELFRYTAEVQHYGQHYPGTALPVLPHEDYQVARYWEDLLEMITAILDPVPDDIAARIADRDAWQAWENAITVWRDTQEDSDNWDIQEAAMWWWYRRHWDAGHLAHPPNVWLWRTGGAVHMRWDNRATTAGRLPVWTAQVGEITLPVDDFLSAVQSFHVALLDAMGKRVAAALADWTRPEIVLDLPQLEREQQERRNWLEYAIAPHAVEQRRGYDWSTVRTALTRLETILAQSPQDQP